MSEIRLHDTRSGQVRTLEPRDPGRVGIYACGPTVYSRIHIGNARPFVVFSLLARFLRHEGLDASFVANVTDVNDKIYTAAARAGVPSEQLAREMTAHYIADTDALALGRPTHEPLASEWVPQMVEYIEALIERGHAYAAGGDVLFRVRSDGDYGSLSHRRVDDMDQGEGVEGADRKEDPLDFALWKARKPDEDTWWPSPWGPGRPGWHIECSAMAEGTLGVPFDIHGGGADLIFPHHENEAAQTRAARGRELSTLWVHNGMIQVPRRPDDGPGESLADELQPAGETDTKMSKSLGNVAALHEVIERYGRDAVVMFLVSGHYRQPLAFSPEALQASAQRVQRISEALGRLREGPSPQEVRPLRDRFIAALADDYNTPSALAALFEWIREANRSSDVGDGDLREMLELLGLEGLRASCVATSAEELDPEIARLLAAREAARAARDFAGADRLRDEIRALGWEIRDSADGPSAIRSQQ